ncbi:MAG: hypothetical protein HC880_17440 [Bacteroidia bacterium]|nr:hypothetical protein [Bacteroidia bacterium]
MNFLRFDKLIGNLSKYAEVKYQLTKIEAEEKLAKGTFILGEIVVYLALFGVFTLFINLAIAFYINSLYQTNYLGFVMVAFFQVVLFFLLRISLWLFPQPFLLLIKSLLKRFERKVFHDSKKLP